MKFLVLFLSAIVLMLTIVPCCAFEEDESHTHKASTAEKHDKCTEEDDDCCKSCSPFYVCGTCVGFTVNQPPLLTFMIYLKPIQHSDVYLPIELHQMPYSIWQPPQLG